MTNRLPAAVMVLAASAWAVPASAGTPDHDRAYAHVALAMFEGHCAFAAAAGVMSAEAGVSPRGGVRISSRSIPNAAVQALPDWEEAQQRPAR